MTTTMTTLTADPIRRSFEVRLERAATDERVVGGCCVPFNVPTLVSDGAEPYREMFAPGAFARQLAVAERVELRYRHGDTLGDRIGRAVSLEERGDGLHGTFRVFPGVSGDQALTLVDEGLLTGLSISGVPLRTMTAKDGTVVRQRVHLEHVGLVDEAAYADAAVTMRRERIEPMIEPAPAVDPWQLERLRAVGITVGSLTP